MKTATTNGVDILWHRENDYVFSCSVTATNTKTVTVGLIKNGHVILKISTAITPWESGSSTVVVEMDKGDKVWVKRLAHDRQFI